jgi:hypothetical protein
MTGPVTNPPPGGPGRPELVAVEDSVCRAGLLPATEQAISAFTPPTPGPGFCWPTSLAGTRQ